MTDRYNDIMNMERPEPSRQRMSLSERATQFAPFAALNGHHEALAETARVTNVFVEPGEYELQELSTSLTLMLMQNRTPEIEIRYFQPDMRKSGGEYLTLRGQFRKIDEVTHELIMADSTRVSLSNINSLRILNDD
ncbi:MAG: hypothetical protein K2O00_04250 [Muribaculaceae bacterium]|nr:hypothetical protein [Muribaculaceae bacterium]